MRGTLERRQADLTIVIEDVHDPHNVSAMLRSCDAVGVAGAHLIYTVEERPELSKGVSASALRWIDLNSWESVADCYSALRERGFTIYTTSLTHEAIDLYDLDLTAPIAILFGNETRGASAEAVALADGCVYIPMMGMVESLNVSVACAVTLYEALRQRRAAGRYDSPSLPPDNLDARLNAWLLRDGRDPAAVTQDAPAGHIRAENRRQSRGGTG
ncbi:MAG TPA: RNA methyltransferase [Chloroflexi bacterium]|jgi:tRNA (guanosine-2'-O-)-methyltransferase|nr:RNA methyltransferase [Chloroflexota bacterium]